MGKDTTTLLLVLAGLYLVTRRPAPPVEEPADSGPDAGEVVEVIVGTGQTIFEWISGTFG